MHRKLSTITGTPFPTVARAIPILLVLLAAPGAARAQNDGWSQSGNALYLNPSYQKVGIGTSTPKASLDVTGGDFSIGRAGKQFLFHSQWWLANPEFLTIAPQNGTSWSFDKSISLWTDGNFQVGNGLGKVVMGQAYGQSLLWGGSYLGFNAARKTSGWSTDTDTASNGGAVIFSSVGGDIFFSTLPSTGGAPRTGIPDTTVASNVRMAIKPNGNVGIGTIHPGSYKLAVEGTIGAREINVTLASPWPDYVFSPDYPLMPLDRLEQFIADHGHLPDVPSQEEVHAAGGFDLGRHQVLLLQKVEELTRYLIELRNENVELRQSIEALQARR